MTSKTKKAQVVLAAINQERHSFDFLLLQMNEKRGNFWQNVTGKLEDDETFEEGGLREAIEETGLNIESIVDIVSLKLTFDFIDQRERKAHEECFLIVMDSKWDVKIDPHEHQSYKWVSIDEIHPDIVKYSSNFEALEKAQRRLKLWGH